MFSITENGPSVPECTPKDLAHNRAVRDRLTTVQYAAEQAAISARYVAEAEKALAEERAVAAAHRKPAIFNYSIRSMEQTLIERQEQAAKWASEFIRRSEAA